MKRAMWHGAVIAEAETIQVVDGYPYFAKEAVKWEHLRPIAKTSVCGWKGTASYYDVVVDGEVNPDAAWYYPDPRPAAEQVRDRVAFWHGVRVQQRPDG